MRRGVAVGLAGLAAAGAIAVPLGMSQGGSIDVLVGSTPTAAAAATANLWIDPNGGTCARQSVAGAYSDAGACSSFQAAYTACSSGDTIKVKAGSYAAQSIARSTRTGPSPCTFSEDGGDVILAGLSVLGDWSSFNGFTSTTGVDMDDNDGSNRIYNVTFTDMQMQGGFYLANTENTTVKGTCTGVRSCTADICCKAVTLTAQAKLINMAGQVAGNPSSHNTNLTFDGVAIHDLTRDDPSIHTECLFAMAVQTMTVKNSQFWNCAAYDISIGRINTDLDPSNVLIENNVFEHTDSIAAGDGGGSYVISLAHVSTRYNGLVFRNNSFAQVIQLFDVTDIGCPCDTPTGAYSQTTFYSNVMELTGGRCTTPSQPAGQPAMDYNVVDISDSGCGTHKTVVGDSSALWPGFAGHDYHLASGSAAIGAGAPTQSTATDIGGHARDGAPDAGAYEFGSGS